MHLSFETAGLFDVQNKFVGVVSQHRRSSSFIKYVVGSNEMAEWQDNFYFQQHLKAATCICQIYKSIPKIFWNVFVCFQFARLWCYHIHYFCQHLKPSKLILYSLSFFFFSFFYKFNAFNCKRLPPRGNSRHRTQGASRNNIHPGIDPSYIVRV